VLYRRSSTRLAQEVKEMLKGMMRRKPAATKDDGPEAA
jgi:hypothetical protein